MRGVVIPKQLAKKPAKICANAGAEKSYATGNISSTITALNADASIKVVVGGLIGLQGGNISKCYTVGNINSYADCLSYVGRLVGCVNESYKMSECYYNNGQVVTCNSSEGWVPNINELGTSSTLEEIGVIFKDESENDPTVEAEEKIDIVYISTSKELLALALTVNSGEECDGKYFVLTDDIDLTGITWRPIGGSSRHFAGTFDGNEHTIYNMCVTSSNIEYYGLFGFVTGKIINLNISSFSIKIDSHEDRVYIGGLVGYSSEEVSNCFAEGVVDCKFLSTTYGLIGGLLGCGYAKNSQSNVNIICDTDAKGVGYYDYMAIGGLIGSGSAVNSCSMGTMCIKTSSLKHYVGGLIGSGSAVNSCSYVKTEIETNGGALYVGGLIGSGSSLINSLAVGDITANTINSAIIHIGGLVAELDYDYSLVNCYKYAGQKLNYPMETYNECNSFGYDVERDILNQIEFYIEQLCWDRFVLKFDLLDENLISCINTSKIYYECVINSVGGGVTNITEAIAKDGGVIELVAITKDGYKFIGWYAEDVFITDEKIFYYPVTKNIVITAKFVQDVDNKNSD